VKLTVLILLIGVSGCGDSVTLRNQAGMTVTCGPYYRDSIGSNSMALREAQCVSDYQKQGYQRVPN
jgi:hypothetical protein